MRRLIALACAFALACALPLIPASAQVTGPVSCSANVLNTSIATATTTSLITVPAGSFVCGYLLYGAATASAMTAQFEYGAGSSCTTPTALTPAIPVAASTIVSDNSFNFRGFTVPANKSLCVVTAGTTVALGVQVFYAANQQTPPVVAAQTSVACNGLLGSLAGTANNAYAVCLVNSSYAGSAIHITRTSDSTGTNIGFNADGSLNASALSSFCSGTTCGVDTYYDQVGSANATQVTAANQPVIVASGTTNTLNGHPVPLCNDSLISGSDEFWSVTPATQAQPLGFAFSFQLTSTGGQANGAHLFDENTGGTRVLVGFSNASSYTIFAGGSALTGGTLDLLTHNFVTNFNGVSSQGFIDGTSTISGSPGANGVGGGSYLLCKGFSAGNGMPGYFAMGIIFNNVVSAGDISTIHTASKYWGGS